MIQDKKFIVKCPETDCKVVFSEKEISVFGSQQILEKLKEGKRNLAIDKDPKKIRCPRPDCHFYVKSFKVIKRKK